MLIYKSNLYLLHYEALDNVADLDIIELLDLHTALVAACNFLNVVLEAAQRCQLALVNNDIIAQHAHGAAALDLAVEDVAAGNGADLGDLVGLADLRMTDDDLLELRCEHALHCGFDLINAVVDDAVHTHIDVCSRRAVACGIVRPDVKADYDSAGGRSKHNIGLVDSADAAVNDFNSDFLVRELFKALLDSLDRALDIRLDDDVEFLKLALLEG